MSEKLFDVFPVEGDVSRSDGEHKNHHLNGTENKVTERDDKKSVGVFRSETERDQWHKIGKTHQNGIEVQISGQGGNEQCQKEKKIKLNPELSHGSSCNGRIVNPCQKPFDFPCQAGAYLYT